MVVCAGEGRNQGVARLVLNGCGIAVPEIFGAIRDDAFTFVSLRTKAYLIAPNRQWAQKVLFARANAF